MNLFKVLIAGVIASLLLITPEYLDAQTRNGKGTTKVLTGLPKALQPRPLGPGQFKSGNLIYTVVKGSNETEVSVVAGSKLSGIVKIPAQVSNAGKAYKVTFIPNGAFSNCNITRLVLPKSLKVIDRGSFNGVEAIEVPDIAMLCNIRHLTNEGLHVPIYVNGNLVKDLIIPSGVKSISDFAFMNARKVRSVTIPAGVEYIGKGAFGGMTDCVKVTIEDSSEPLVFENGNFSLSKLDEVYVGRDIEYSDDEKTFPPFYKQRNLSVVEFSKYVTCIPREFLSRCIIGEIRFQEGSELGSIGEYAMSFCKVSSPLIFPESVKMIDKGALSFAGMNNLSFPGLIFIGEYALQNSNFITADFGTELAEISKDAFNTFGAQTLIIPASVSTVSDRIFQYAKIDKLDIRPVDNPGGAAEKLVELFDKEQ
ncbi:MAG: leucine-rich repeat protein [Bacteroides sp.]|nr:leucine-rich repeat protein [Bacteroides sp.]